MWLQLPTCKYIKTRNNVQEITDHIVFTFDFFHKWPLLSMIQENIKLLLDIIYILILISLFQHSSNGIDDHGSVAKNNSLTFLWDDIGQHYMCMLTYWRSYMFQEIFHYFCVRIYVSGNICNRKYMSISIISCHSIKWWGHCHH